MANNNFSHEIAFREFNCKNPGKITHLVIGLNPGKNEHYATLKYGFSNRFVGSSGTVLKNMNVYGDMWSSLPSSTESLVWNLVQYHSKGEAEVRKQEEKTKDDIENFFIPLYNSIKNDLKEVYILGNLTKDLFIEHVARERDLTKLGIKVYYLPHPASRGSHSKKINLIKKELKSA